MYYGSMGNGNHTLKMADIDKFPEIIDDNRKKARLLHNLYNYLNPFVSKKYTLASLTGINHSFETTGLMTSF